MGFHGIFLVFSCFFHGFSWFLFEFNGVLMGFYGILMGFCRIERDLMELNGPLGFNPIDPKICWLVLVYVSI